MNKSRPLSFIALFIGAAVLLGNCQDAGLLSRVVKNYTGEVSLSASFDVKIFWKVREKEETKHGKIVLSPHDRFRVSLGESEWISDGATLWQYDKTLSPPQVIVRQLSSCDPSQLPSRLLSKYLSLYAFKEQGNKGKSTAFAWSADSAAAEVKGEARRISFTVDSKTALVQELVVMDKSGNVSTYTFHSASMAASPAPTFAFDIPKGARILDERQ